MQGVTSRCTKTSDPATSSMQGSYYGFYSNVNRCTETNDYVSKAVAGVQVEPQREGTSDECSLSSEDCRMNSWNRMVRATVRSHKKDDQLPTDCFYQFSRMSAVPPTGSTVQAGQPCYTAAGGAGEANVVHSLGLHAQAGTAHLLKCAAVPTLC
ncbi:hypothetical protein NDU88_000720 [Pleurodeles waltl]|uniref:Uncharacterized protein n=1 Tax=Pleurodeles waltl TaxID=8319 RepID=A0AAV7SXF7_PLEWA|nr:hypothetical protein NDU88_000720 [Pleurodeles waltl]